MTDMLTVSFDDKNLEQRLKKIKDEIWNAKLSAKDLKYAY